MKIFQTLLTIATLALAGWSGTASAVVVKTIADLQLSENGTTGLGDATDGGNGTGTTINARWNFAATPNPNRNEWAVFKFDLSAFPNKSEFANVALRTYMNRTSADNSKSLRLYALTPGTSGEDWNETGTTYGSMPGFTFDANSTTNLLSVGGGNPLQDLGTFSVTEVGNEGNVSTINPASLTNLIRGMGSNNLLTVLISTSQSYSGQWRVASREATSTETGVLSGTAGSLAAFLQFNLVPVTSGVEGDYNNNGVVDAADYTVWRNGGILINEGVSPTVVDIADYLFWKERYGTTMPIGSGAFAARTVAVPEPGTLYLLLALTILTPGTIRTAR